MTDGLNRLPRIGEPESPFEAGIQGVRSQPKTIMRFLAGEGMADTSISGPVMLQQPPRWSHDFDENGQTRATLRSVIPVYENPPQVPTPPEGSSDTTTATTEFVDRAMHQAVLEAVAKAKIGVTDGFNAAPGQIGEFLQIQVPQPGIEITAANMTVLLTLEVPAGDWDLQAQTAWSFTGTAPPSTTPPFYYATSISDTTNFPGFPNLGGASATSTLPQPGGDFFLSTFWRLNRSVSTSVFLLTYSNFNIGRVYSYGFMSARRRR
jgi:hypothetical protein